MVQDNVYVHRKHLNLSALGGTVTYVKYIPRIEKEKWQEEILPRVIDHILLEWKTFRDLALI